MRDLHYDRQGSMTIIDAYAGGYLAQDPTLEDDLDLIAGLASWAREHAKQRKKRQKATP